MNYKDVYRTVITDPNHRLTFGKHKGETIRTVIEIDPEYLLFCESKGIFEMDHVIHDELFDMNPYLRP